jgi:hypothetical protein
MKDAVTEARKASKGDLMSIRKKLAVGAAIAALSLVLGAVMFAPVLAGAQESSTADEQQADELTYRVARIRDALDELVEGGTITSAQADAVAEHLAGTFPHRDRHFLGRERVLAGLTRIAEVIGIEESILADALRDGQSIAEIATAHGVDPQEVIDSLMANHQARLDQLVAAGRITSEEADEKAALFLSHVTDLVNGEYEFRPGFMVRPAWDSPARNGNA